MTPIDPRDPRESCPGGRSEWLVEEIGRYLAADATVEEQAMVARGALRNGHAAFARFVESRVDPYEVVGVEVSIRRPTGHTCRFGYRQVPGPISFLVFCAANCLDGDEVTLRQTTALAGSVGATESWPFGLESAEQMTVPAVNRIVAHSLS